MLKNKTIKEVASFLRDKGLESLSKKLSGRKIIDWPMLAQFINSEKNNLKADDWSRLAQMVEKNELS